MHSAQMQREMAQALPLVTRGWRQLADAALAEFRVSNSMAWCLIYLDRLGPEARQIDLAQAVGVSQPSTAHILNQLEAAGLVERVPHPEDRRANRVALTAAGRELMAKIETRLGALRRELFAGVPDAEVASALRLLDLLAERIAERRSADRG
jgi:MarR family transcriptional regulator for hemolysin